MAQTFSNPYQPADALGQGLRNIAIGLFGRRNTRDPALDAAHAGLYDEQMKKAAAERQLIESQVASRSPETQEQIIAANVRMPGGAPSVRAYLRDLAAGGPNAHEYEPYREDLSKWVTAVKAGFGDKSTSGVDIQKAVQLATQSQDRAKIIAGTLNPTRAAQAYGATGESGVHVPYVSEPGGVGTLNVYEGTRRDTPLGLEKQKTEQAEQGERRGRESQARASAGEHGARTKQINKETETGLKAGAPVAVVTSAGPSTLVSPFQAPGYQQSPARAGTEIVWGTDGVPRVAFKVDAANQGSAAAPRPVVRAPRTKLSDKDIDTALVDLLTEHNVKRLDPLLKQAIRMQAEKEWQSGAEGPANAIDAAMKKIAPEGFEEPFSYFLGGGATAKGGMRPIGGHTGPPGVPTPIPPSTSPGVPQTIGTNTPLPPPPVLPGGVKPAPGGAAPAPGASPQAGGIPPRPKGKSNAQLMNEALDMVNSGKKDMEQVNAVLKAWGVGSIGPASEAKK